MGEGKRHKKFLDDYEDWKASYGPGHFGELMRLVEAEDSDHFGELTGQRNVFHLGKRAFDFNPYLAEYDGRPAFVKDVSTEEAFTYLWYLKVGGTGEFVDPRYAVTVDLSTPEHDLVRVSAQDILDGSWPTPGNE